LDRGGGGSGGFGGFGAAAGVVAWKGELEEAAEDGGGREVATGSARKGFATDGTLVRGCRRAFGELAQTGPAKGVAAREDRWAAEKVHAEGALKLSVLGFAEHRGFIGDR
jgi:hypothetical protein